MRRAHLLVTLLLLGGCAGMGVAQLDETWGEPRPRNRVTVDAASLPVDYWRDVKPILDGRCVVCHACYDAPCQLKLGAFEGIDRGASPEVVYDGARLTSAAPTRLFEDARSTAEWRGRGFHPVLNEREQSTEANLRAGVMARILAQKREHPLPDAELLPESFDLALNRDQQCPTIETFDAYESDYPLWGMPYGLPGIADGEHEVLIKWLALGAPYYPAAPVGTRYQSRIAHWEKFLNGPTRKERLMSRYIYEHLFLGNIYFDDIEERRFFRLVRSRTGPGLPVERVVTRRPYDDPGVDRVYYRLVPVPTTIVAKTHMPYAFSDARMARYKELFLNDPYQVDELPGYDPKIASNPFVAFAAIPSKSRYRFMLDEARFTIMGFIKGPVCRGQIALNVIEDHFWVVFVDPDNRVMNEDGHFLKRESANLRLPSSEGSQTSALIPWMRYADLEDRYLAAKGAYMKEVLTSPSDITLDIVWDGDGANTNAALTVFRHFDSATVVKGFVGDAPKTAWLIEYPLLERIHYLLVAGFDVYGNVGHQLNSRLYMDFLRMEGEFNFITLLPADARVPTREHWYRGASHRVKGYIYGDRISFDVDSGIPYGGGDPQTELFVLLREHLGSALDRSYALEAVGDEAITSSLEALAALEGSRLAWLPESAFLTITGHPDGADMSFSLLRNTGHSNVSHLFSEAREILPDENTLTVARGFVGAYPNAFYRVERTELAAFVEAVRSLQSESDYAALVDRFGVRRGDPGFWAHSDGIHAASAGSRPVEAGLFDYNRLENR